MAHRRANLTAGPRRGSRAVVQCVNRREFVALAAGAPLDLRATLAAPAARGARHLRRRVAARRRRPADASASSRRIPTLPDPRAIERVGERRGRLPHGGRRRLDRRAAAACGTCCADSSSRGTPPRIPTAVTRSSPTRAEAASSRSTSLRGPRGRPRRRCRAGRATSRSTRPVSRLWVGLGSACDRTSRSSTTRTDCGTCRTLTPGFGAHDVGLAPDGRLWVTAGASPASWRSPMTLHAADAAPQHVTFGHGRAYVTSGDGGRPARAVARRARASLDADPRRLVQRPARRRAA